MWFTWKAPHYDDGQRAFYCSDWLVALLNLYKITFLVKITLSVGCRRKKQVLARKQIPPKIRENIGPLRPPSMGQRRVGVEKDLLTIKEIPQVIGYFVPTISAYHSFRIRPSDNPRAPGSGTEANSSSWWWRSSWSRTAWRLCSGPTAGATSWSSRRHWWRLCSAGRRPRRGRPAQCHPSTRGVRWWATRRRRPCRGSSKTCPPQKEPSHSRRGCY